MYTRYAQQNGVKRCFDLDGALTKNSDLLVAGSACRICFAFLTFALFVNGSNSIVFCYTFSFLFVSYEFVHVTLCFQFAGRIRRDQFEWYFPQFKKVAFMNELQPHGARGGGVYIY